MEVVKYLTAFTAVIFILTLYKIIQNEDEAVKEIKAAAVDQKTKRPIVILLWNKAYDKHIFMDEELSNCSCEITTNRTKALEVV